MMKEESVVKAENVDVDSTASNVGSNVYEYSTKRLDGTRGFNCCSRPHGNYMFFPLMLTTVAFVLSVSAHSLCNFVSRTVQLKNGNEEQSATNQLGFSTSVGIWSFMDEAYELCFKMPFDDVDAYYQTARTMSSLASAFGGILLIIMWFSPCIGMKTQCWVACGIGLVLVSLFESLTFLIFESDLCHESENFTYNCTLNNGGKTGIAAAVFWFLASVSVCYVPPPAGIPDYGVVQHTYKTETVKPDGTKVVETKTFYSVV